MYLQWQIVKSHTKDTNFWCDFYITDKNTPQLKLDNCVHIGGKFATSTGIEPAEV